MIWGCIGSPVAACQTPARAGAWQRKNRSRGIAWGPWGRPALFSAANREKRHSALFANPPLCCVLRGLAPRAGIHSQCMAPLGQSSARERRLTLSIFRCRVAHGCPAVRCHMHHCFYIFFKKQRHLVEAVGKFSKIKMKNKFDLM